MTPADFATALKTAKPGDVLPLTGDCGHIFIRNMAFAAPGIVLDCSAATLANIRLQNVQGVTIKGGAFTPTDYLGAVYAEKGSARIVVSGIDVNGSGLWAGVIVHDGADVSVIGSRFDCPKVGVSATRLSGGLIQANAFWGYAIDGVDLAGGHDVIVELNSFSGGLLVDDHHPDAIQGWPLAGDPPPYGHIIRKNQISGPTQGIGFYDHNVGGYDNITIEDNDIAVTYPGAITLRGSRGSKVRINRVRTLPDSEHRASINTDAARSGNTVGAYLKWASDNDPPAAAN